MTARERGDAPRPVPADAPPPPPPRPASWVRLTAERPREVHRDRTGADG